MKKYNKQTGFTIVELLVVIVVIGVLAAITIVAYSGITSRANLASLQSDIESNSKTLKLYYALNGYYPITLDANNCPATPTADTTRCLKLSPNNSYTYSPSTPTNPQDFRLTIANTSTGNYYSNNSKDISCPLNFIIVPGSATYNTNDFCVMKYEASRVGSTTTPVSSPTNIPWVNISQTNTVSYSQNVAGCTGCHLITEAEWMTLAQNVLSVASNWSGGTVGAGFIYSGHNDGVPNNSLAADTNDANGYAGTGNVSPSNQRRTLTLTNGEVIWDLAGNEDEWTSGTLTTGQPGVSGEVIYGWKEWTSVNTVNVLTPNPAPSSTGLSGSGSWNSSQGIGKVYSNAGETTLHAIRRGGTWAYASNYNGVLAVIIDGTIGTSNYFIGFRVSR